MNHVDRRHGFTLIELMLAMAFVSALLIAIAMTVVQVASIYNRGITLKEVNQSGRSIASELQRSIAQTALFSVDSTNPGSKFINQEWGGRLCIGQYSYVWNYGKYIKLGDTSRLNVYSNSTEGIRFVKVLDANASYCTTVPLPKIDSSSAVEMIDVSEHDLSMHSFMISSSNTAIDNKTGQQLYNIEFLLGTNDQLALMFDPSGFVTGCKPPNEVGSDPTYCSVNQFNIIARAGNTVK